MVSPQFTSCRENEAVKRAWNFGGSDRYPDRLPSRPRPPQERKPDPAIVEGARDLSAFDEALEHCCWCRERGMSPQDVAESINSKHVPHTWGAVIDILERHIVKMRGGK